MARKKREEGSSGGNAPWLNTFADLMNLLLCFFVLLFAMSDVDGEKFEQISISLSNSFGIFDGGGSALYSGQLISSGMNQLNDLDQYFNSMGQASKKNGKEDEGNKDSSTGNQDETTPGKDSGLNGNQDGTGQTGNQEGPNPDGTNEGSGQSDDKQGNNSAQGEDIGLSEAMDKINDEMKKASEDMFDEVSDLTDQYNLGDYVELDIDPDHQFVQISLKGSILFDSGEAEIKAGAKPILSKVGEILAQFKGYSVEIEGHTDNIPMTSGSFQDNNWLSSARALKAAEYLIETHNLDPSKIKYSGRGEYEPVASNATSDGRAKNRRIEIKIFTQLSGD